MRKFLISTTAIVPAVLFAGGAMAADTVDVVVGADESFSTTSELDFLKTRYSEIDDGLTQSFQHGLFGYRENSTTTDNGSGTDPVTLGTGASLFGTADEVQAGAAALSNSGGVVDGLNAAQFGLNSYQSSFRSGSTRQIILFTDTTRETTQAITSDALKANLEAADAALSVVTKVTITASDGTSIVAVAEISGELVGWDESGNRVSGLTTDNIADTPISSAGGDNRNDDNKSVYQDIVLETGGVLANTDIVNSNPDGFIAAFQAALDAVVQDATVSTTTTAESQESIVSETTRVTVRAIARQVATAISNRARAVATGGVLQAMQDGKSTGINAGDEMSMPIAVWVDGTYSSLDNDSPTEAFDGDTTTALVGVDVSPMNGLVVGVAVGLENTDLDLSTSNGDKETDGFSGYAYAGYQFNDFISVDAVLGYGSFDTDISETIDGATVTGDYDSDRYLGSINLNGTYEYESVLFTGTVGYLFTQEAVDSYTASDGERVDPDNTNLAQGSVGLEVGYLFEQVYPFVRGTLENDFVTESGADSTGGNVGGGLIYFPTDNLTLGANAGFDVGRDDEENFSIGLNARYRF